MTHRGISSNNPPLGSNAKKFTTKALKAGSEFQSFMSFLIPSINS
jgi:hypothetical protein